MWPHRKRQILVTSSTFPSPENSQFIPLLLLLLWKMLVSSIHWFHLFKSFPSEFLLLSQVSSVHFFLNLLHIKHMFHSNSFFARKFALWIRQSDEGFPQSYNLGLFTYRVKKCFDTDFFFVTLLLFISHFLTLCL